MSEKFNKYDLLRGIGIPLIIFTSLYFSLRPSYKSNIEAKRVASEIYWDSVNRARNAADTVIMPVQSSALYESLEWRLEHDSVKLQEELDAKKPEDLRVEDHNFMQNKKYNSQGRYE